MAEPTTKRVTSADVARVAGVSRATVSYVLNDTPRQTISAGTRTRVLDAAARLGYSPSAAARTLRTGRSDVVLCLLPDWPIGPEVGSMLSQLSSALTRHGLTLVVHPGNRQERPMTELWKAITPAAVIAYTEFSDAEIAAMRSAGVAVVEAVPRRRGRSSAVPQELVGRRQAEHLIRAGHTHLGYAYPDDQRVRFFAEPRLAGVRAACVAQRLPTPVGLTVPLDPAAASDAVRRWQAAGVTAVCAYNDEVALAVLAGVRGAGLSVPADLAVIGVDDIPTARLADPPLTTVTTDQAAVGAHLAAAVVAVMSGRAAPELPAPDIVRVVTRGSA
ncbi:LacI family DNA-binding transcriptional regulator [Actinoplanes sp. LDG1-06]|uniref:LacI family DNA-binding transcriptional regulator n=1 Tax=Paractinoplanes ovalisporus TaxID=2810368 RepID=A0ABS2ATB3_9ACTN|nr:LacI family DNA-binding transcriptional regulator [Actinoplanes ovalisporus]MBM2623092.1 LacI family DNA-binding transcriptional regulator [Actinoplanes ovalisporus]